MSVVYLLSIAGQYIAAAVLLFILFSRGYRIVLHPLRHYPGPFVAKLTDAYGAYHALRMRLHLTTSHDHSIYGPVMRHGPNKLVFSTPEALHDIYDNDRIVKSQAYLVTVNPPHHCIFNVIDQAPHRVKRRLIGKAVSERSMRLFEDTMLSQVNIFIEQIHHASVNPGENSPLDLSPMLKSLALDIVCLLAFGYDLHTQTTTTYHHIKDGILAANYFQNTQIQFPFLKKARINQLVHLFTNAHEKRLKFQSTIEHLVRSRLGSNEIRHDLYSIAENDMDSGGPDSIRSKEIWAEALFFFLAGGDTVATCLSALFFYLSRNQSSYTKLRDEIRSTFDKDTDIRAGPQLSSCKYLRACIEEALRMSPPVGGTLWREQASADDKPLFIDGHFVPRGTQIGLNIYHLHHNEDYFPEPFSYKPERWLSDETTDNQREIMQDAFAPFSIGYRGCAGKPMAYLEASLVMAKALWHFDFQPTPGDLGKLGAGTKGNGGGRDRVNEFQLFDVFASTHRGPCLVFHQREDMLVPNTAST